LKIPKLSRTRIRASAALLIIGFAATAIGVQLFTNFPSHTRATIALALWFLGFTLLGAGALCPFGRAVSGALSGFILAGLYILDPIRSIGTNANKTFMDVAAELEAQQAATGDRTGSDPSR
jgi:hypothetical protein